MLKTNKTSLLPHCQINICCSESFPTIEKQLRNSSTIDNMRDVACEFTNCLSNPLSFIYNYQRILTKAYPLFLALKIIYYDF